LWAFPEYLCACWAPHCSIISSCRLRGWFKSKGGQTAILVRWSAAQRNTEMLAYQRTGKNSRPAPAEYRNWGSASPLLHYLREAI
jgi:hypothetical protein